jgi:hypothetical protein
MLFKFILVFLLIICIAALPILFFLKAGLQLQYKNILERRSAGSLSDFWVFNWKDGDARERRMDAFLLFPVFFPVDLEDKKPELVDIKYKIRRLHLAFYGLMIVLILLGSYVSRAYPDGFLN